MVTAKQIIGLDVNEAIRVLNATQQRWRYSSIDGKASIVTMDLDPSRFNLVVEDGKVKAVKFG